MYPDYLVSSYLAVFWPELHHLLVSSCNIFFYSVTLRTVMSIMNEGKKGKGQDTVGSDRHTKLCSMVIKLLNCGAQACWFKVYSGLQL